MLNTTLSLLNYPLTGSSSLPVLTHLPFPYLHIFSSRTYTSSLPALTNLLFPHSHIFSSRTYTSSLPVLTHLLFQHLHIFSSRTYTSSLPAPTHLLFSYLHIFSSRTYTSSLPVLTSLSSTSTWHILVFMMATMGNMWQTCSKQECISHCYRILMPSMLLLRRLTSLPPLI